MVLSDLRWARGAIGRLVFMTTLATLVGCRGGVESSQDCPDGIDELRGVVESLDPDERLRYFHQLTARPYEAETLYAVLAPYLAGTGGPDEQVYAARALRLEGLVQHFSASERLTDLLYRAALSHGQRQVLFTSLLLEWLSLSNRSNVRPSTQALFASMFADPDTFPRAAGLAGALGPAASWSAQLLQHGTERSATEADWWIGARAQVAMGIVAPEVRERLLAEDPQDPMWGRALPLIARLCADPEADALIRELLQGRDTRLRYRVVMAIERSRHLCPQNVELLLPLIARRDDVGESATLALQHARSAREEIRSTLIEVLRLKQSPAALLVLGQLGDEADRPLVLNTMRKVLRRGSHPAHLIPVWEAGCRALVAFGSDEPEVLETLLEGLHSKNADIVLLSCEAFAALAPASEQAAVELTRAYLSMLERIEWWHPTGRAKLHDSMILAHQRGIPVASHVALDPDSEARLSPALRCETEIVRRRLRSSPAERE